MQQLPLTAFLAAIAMRTAIVFVVLIVGLRMVGRRHSGEMSPEDLLLILLMANGVQNAMTHGSGRLAVGLVSSGTLIGVGWLASWAFRKSAALERAVVGHALIVVHRGRLVERNLRRAQVTREHVMAAIRKQGLARLGDVRLAVLEKNGALSVVPDHKATG